MSVQDVLDELAASRGAFYHYFESKIALLEAVVDRVVEVALAAVTPVVTDPELPALEKLERLFTGIAGWKAERKELMLALIEVWCSDDNAIVREKLRRSTVIALVPLLAEIIKEGRAEGLMSADSPEGAARAVVSLLQGAQDLALELFLARQEGAIPFEFVGPSLGAYTQAIERILGVAAGSLSLMDEATLRLWFG
jgi:AcrR family transcriptional regulator